MGAIFALPMLILAVLFVLGIIELFIAALLAVRIIVKKKKKHSVKKVHYVIMIILIILGIGSVIPHYGFKAFIKSTMNMPDPARNVRIKDVSSDFSHFTYNGKKYISMTDQLNKKIAWADDIAPNDAEAFQIKTKKEPVATVKYTVNPFDLFDEEVGFTENLIGFTIMFFYDDLMLHYLYTFENGTDDMLAVKDYEADMAEADVSELYVLESAIDQNIKRYADMHNYEFLIKDPMVEYATVKQVYAPLNKSAVTEIEKNALLLLKAEHVLSSEKDFDLSKYMKDNDMEYAVLNASNDEYKTMYCYAKSKDGLFYGYCAQFIEFDQKYYQAFEVYEVKSYNEKTSSEDIKLGSGNENLYIMIELSDNAAAEIKKRFEKQPH